MPILVDPAPQPTPQSASDPGDVLGIPLIPVVALDHWSWKRVAFLAVAVVLALLGFLLVPLPVASGVIFWVPAALMLGIALPPIARFLNAQEARLPERCRRWLRPRLWRKARRTLKRAIQ